MMGTVKAIQISLILAISLSILVVPVYLHYCRLVEADLFSIDLNIENPDHEVLLVNQEGDAGMSVSCVFSVVFPGATVVNQFQSFPFQILPFDQRTSILRC